MCDAVVFASTMLSPRGSPTSRCSALSATGSLFSGGTGCCDGSPCGTLLSRRVVGSSAETLMRGDGTGW